jgi:hypothetical protein
MIPFDSNILCSLRAVNNMLFPFLSTFVVRTPLKVFGGFGCCGIAHLEMSWPIFFGIE